MIISLLIIRITTMKSSNDDDCRDGYDCLVVGLEIP
jgi:hypothetical protein